MKLIDETHPQSKIVNYFFMTHKNSECQKCQIDHSHAEETEAGERAETLILEEPEAL